MENRQLSSEEEKSTEWTTAREIQEEGKRKSRKLSSQKQVNNKLRLPKSPKETDERKWKKGSTCETAVGAKQGRTKGNEQRSE